MLVLVEFPEVDQLGFYKGKIVINLDSIVHMREVSLNHTDERFTEITTRELRADQIMAAELGASASSSDTVHVGRSLNATLGYLGSIKAK